MLRELKFVNYSLSKKKWIKSKGEGQVFELSPTVATIVEESKGLLSIFVLEKRKNGFEPIAFYDEAQEKLWPLTISEGQVTLGQEEVQNELQKDIFRVLVREAYKAGIVKK